MAKKDNITQEKEQTIIYETGEIIQQKTTQIIPVGNEPNYYKVYFGLKNKFKGVMINVLSKNG